MERALIRTGHGYESGSYGRCEAFDGFTILAAPLGGFDEAARASRSFPGDRAGGPGVTYGSHAIKLATDSFGRGLYILMHNGSGREVWSVPTFYDGGALRAAVLTMPEREQYALLYTLWQLARNAREQAAGETRAEWAQAYVDGRIRKRRKAGRVTVYVETPDEAAMRKRVTA